MLDNKGHEIGIACSFLTNSSLGSERLTVRAPYLGKRNKVDQWRRSWAWRVAPSPPPFPKAGPRAPGRLQLGDDLGGDFIVEARPAGTGPSVCQASATSAREIPFPGPRDGEAEAEAEHLPMTTRRIRGARARCVWAERRWRSKRAGAVRRAAALPAAHRSAR